MFYVSFLTPFNGQCEDADYCIYFYARGMNVTGISMTKREQRGRLGLAVFTVALGFLALVRLAITLESVSRGVNLLQGIALPAAEIWLIWLLWTGDWSGRWLAIFFYLFRGAILLAPLIMISAGAWAVTPAEQAAAGRQVFLQVMLPAMAPYIAVSLLKLTFACWLAFSPAFKAFQYRQRACGGTLWTALRQWREAVSEPTTQECQIGELRLRSGTLLVADPAYISSPQRVEGLPAGRFPVVARIIRYPEGGKRIARVSIRLRAGQVEKRETLGRIGVDSAMVVALDEQTYREHWKEVGPERIGVTCGPDQNRTVAALVGKKFGLRWRPIDGFRSTFVEPISDDLEQQINDYLETFPEYAGYTVLYFRVETNNTVDRLMKAMSDASWCQLPLSDDDEDECLIAFTSGFGDGSYDLIGLYDGEDLLVLEINFIGPEQDKILEGFPFLREASPS